MLYPISFSMVIKKTRRGIKFFCVIVYKTIRVYKVIVHTEVNRLRRRPALQNNITFIRKGNF